MFAVFKTRLPAAVVTCGLILLLAACAGSPASYLAKGNKALAAGQYAEAEIDFMKSAQAKPTFGDAWYGLGSAQLKSGKLGEAYRSLTRASELLPARDDVSVALAEVCVAAYMADESRPAVLYEKVATTSADLLKRNPNSYDGIRLSGYLAMIDRHYPEAISLLRKADAIRPGQGDLTQALMESLIRNGQGPEAEKIGTDFLRRQKDFAPIYDVLYGYLMEAHREADAEKLLRTKIQENLNALAYRLQLGRHLLNAGKPEEMKAVLRQIVDDPRRFPDGRMAAGNFCSGNNRLDEALSYFQAGAMQDQKSKVAYQQRVADTLVAMGQPDRALAVVADILKSDSNNVEARALRVGVELDASKPDAVQAAFLEVTQLLKLRPDDAKLHFDLGRAHLYKGNTDAALSEFQEAIRQNPQFVPAKVLAANLSMQREDFAQARSYSDDIVNLTRGNAGARLLRVAALTGMGNFEEASREVDRLGKEFPDAPEPKLQLAALRLAQKKYAEAESIYRAVYQANRKDLRPLQGLVQTFLAQNRDDAAIQLLIQEKQKSPSPDLDSMLADAALRANKLDLAVQQYAQLSRANPKSAFEHLRLGDAYLRKGELPDAITQFETAKGLEPKDALANAMLALALHNAGRADEAQRAYRETLALQSGNPLVSNNLAYLMAENGGNLDEALKLARDALSQQPSNQAIADTVAVIYIKKNLPDSAIQMLVNATQKDPGQPMYRYHLAMALLQKGDKVGARRECEAALANRPAKPDEEKIRSLLDRLS